MLKSFKEIKQNIEARNAGREFRRDEDGRAVVELCVRDDSDFLSPYSSSSNSVINSEVAEFIDTSVRPLKADERVRLEIHSDEITADEQKVYTSAIHSYYAEQYKSNSLERRRLLILAIAMAVIGVIALAAAITLIACEREIIGDVVEIVAWVFLWETVDILCFQRSLLRAKQMRCLALADCPIDYLSLEKIAPQVSLN
ncbi:MAG: hypothetical protein LUD27_08665 [Clostridia bacterium]|nr:hypothetical protein [Clostridia bacterium]